MNETELNDVDFGTYTEEQYFDDMGRLTQYRCDPDLTEILIRSSFAAGVWMREKGVRFQLGLGRQAFRVDGKFKFWGGLACHIWGGGKELVKALHARAARDGITVLYETPAIALLTGDRGVEGVRVRHQGRPATCGQRRWCWPAAGSRPMPRCGRAISGRIGTSPRCAARASTPARD